MLRVVLADGALTGDFFVSDIAFTVFCFSLLVVLTALLPLDALLFDLSILVVSFFDFSAVLVVDNFSSPLFEQVSKAVVDLPLFTSPATLHVGFLGIDLTMGMLQRSA